MNKRHTVLRYSDNIIAFLSLVIIFASVGYVFANTLEIPISQIVNSAVIGAGILALIVLIVTAITRVLDLKKGNITTYTAKLEN